MICASALARWPLTLQADNHRRSRIRVHLQADLANTIDIERIWLAAMADFGYRDSNGVW
jgi:hypothetical protein